MGTIRREVREQHLDLHPEEEELLTPFLDGFFVTWGARRKAFNTELSVYFLKPEPFITEAYGFTQELMLVYAPYESMQPRTMQAAELFLTTEPAKGRVEKLNYLLISEAPSVEQWVASYVSVNQESRIIIAFPADGLRASTGDSWHVRNVLSRQLYARDLFDYRLPLQTDTYFFGRKAVLADYFDAIKRGENRGLFGLRKTGKTSVLFKLERMLKSEGLKGFFYYDCKSPSIRGLRWFELLERIGRDASARFGIRTKSQWDEVSAADEFIDLVGKVDPGERVVLVFDEIEYISPLAVEDSHWKHDFIDFWQTFWACQSRDRKLVTIIVGVNPYVVEIDTVNGIQNPLFGIVPPTFLRGLGLEEMKGMIRTLGKRMGLQFDPDAMRYMHDRYGGHPLLTRIACSLVNERVKQAGDNRPMLITQTRLVDEQDARDSELVFYCRHVVSELRQFYADEYQMLEFLASGQTDAFMERAAYPEHTTHLKSYGLVAQDDYGAPSIFIPVIGRYIGLELARREGRQTIYKVIDRPLREEWLGRRTATVVHDMRFLEKLIRKAKMPLLFGAASFPEADQLVATRVCRDSNDFDTFINKCNRCFVESIENYGLSISRPDYFWADIKERYPGLWHALHRIKVYRHGQMHLVLQPPADQTLLEYLAIDLERRSPSQVPDLYFVLQQCTLDALLTAIQVEINKLN
jgi:hypothetical protein